MIPLIDPDQFADCQDMAVHCTDQILFSAVVRELQSGIKRIYTESVPMFAVKRRLWTSVDMFSISDTLLNMKWLF